MKDELLLISIAFNKPYLIKHQVRLLKKYVLDPYMFAVADNSSIQNLRPEISKICQEGGVGYYTAPKFPGDGGQGHGACLTWSYNNIVRTSDKRYFGFLDHDVFPTAPNSIIKRMNASGMLGFPSVHAKEGNKWYLHPGFCFYDRSVIKDIDLNFMPVPGLDTGGGNYDILYSRVDMLSLPRMVVKTQNIRDHAPQVAQLDAYYLIGVAEDGPTWVHTFNGSGWVPDKPGTVPKEVLVEKYLASL